MPRGAKMVAKAAEAVAEMAEEHVHEMYANEYGYCMLCGQPANRPIPPGQSVREQALGLARQVRHYEQVPETVHETISPNVRSGV